MKKFLLTAIVALSATTAGASDYIEHKIYSDKNFEQNRAKAVRMSAIKFTMLMPIAVEVSLCWRLRLLKMAVSTTLFCLTLICKLSKSASIINISI